MKFIERIRGVFGTRPKCIEYHDLYSLVDPDAEDIPKSESSKRARRMQFFDVCRKGIINDSIKGSDVKFSKMDLSQMFGVIASTSHMKDQQWRMLRGTICEKALERYSCDQLKYVGDVENGMDFVDKKGLRYECKSQDDIFNDLPSYGSKSNLPNTRTITLINFLGKVRELEQTFDYLIMICNSTYSVGIISWEDMKDHLEVKNDSIKVTIPKEKITMIQEGVIPAKKDAITPSFILQSVFDKV